MTWFWPFLVTSVAKDTWPGSFPYCLSLLLQGGSEPAHLLLAVFGCVSLRPCSPCFCSDHLRVITQPLLPRPQPTGSKIIFSWNILSNWNALAVQRPRLTPEQISLFFLKCRPGSPPLAHAKVTGRSSRRAEADRGEIMTAS